MRFKFALVIGSLCVASGIFAASPHEVFRENYDLILSGRFCCTNGVYFGVGRGVARTDNSASENFARAKAVLNAQKDLICGKAINDVIWPGNLSETTVANLIRIAKEVVDIKAKVGGIEVLTTEKIDAGTYVAVVAAPEENLRNVPKISLDEISKKILDPYWLRKKFKKAPKTLFEFYMTQKTLPFELTGISYDNWTEQQINLFCGISERTAKSKCGSNENAIEVYPEVKNESHKDVFNVNENETIGF